MDRPTLSHSVIERELRHAALWPVEVDGAMGFTRNLSATGLYFELDKSLSPGQGVTLTVQLEVMGRKMQWECQAVVVRRDERVGDAERDGYGAKIIVQRLVDLN